MKYLEVDHLMIDMVAKGLAYFVFDHGTIVGLRLTQKGVEESEKEFPEIPLHSSYMN